MLYFYLARLTDEGRQRLHANPDSLNVVCDQTHVVGAQLLGRYAVLGRYDFVLMAEAVDTRAAARLSLELGARARLQIETLPALALGVLEDRPWEEAMLEPSAREAPEST